MSFTDKVILVTGGSSGIGADAARHLAKLGGKVALVGRNQIRLSEVAEQIINAGSPTPLTIAADVTKDAERIINETVNHFGKLDILVNNVGILSPSNNIENIQMNEFDRIMNTNVRSVIILTQLAVPHLATTKGNIVTVSSVAGLRPIVNMLSYCMSKSTLDQFTKCIALELAPKRIRVNAINPGVIRTPILQSIGIDVAQAEQFFEVYKTKYPVGRVGEVSDTSAAIAYLASDAASFITGTLLPVDGGALAANC